MKLVSNTAKHDCPALPISLKGRPPLEEQRLATERGYPLTLSFALGVIGRYERICNLMCEGCFVTSPGEATRKGTQKRLTLGEIHQLMNEFALAGGRYVVIAGPGEPFYDSFLFPLIDCAGGLGLHFTVFTNMTSLHEMSVVDKLSKRKPHLSIIGKLQTLNPDLYEWMTGQTGAYSKQNCIQVGENKFVPVGLHNLMKAGFNELHAENGLTLTQLGVEVNMFKPNLKDIPKVVQWCLSNGIYPNIEGLEVAGNAVEAESKLRLSKNEKKWLKGQLEGITGTRFLSNRQGTTDFCYGFQGLVLDAYGDARVCYVVGNANPGCNVRDHGVKGAWEKIKEIKSRIKEHIEKEVPPDAAPLLECRLGAVASRLPDKLFKF